MEELKKLEQITLPDDRQKHLVVVDQKTLEYRHLTLEDYYKSAESIKLRDSVPEKIKSHFSTALNLLVYSWFHYPFNVTAQFMAFVSVEMALKERFNVTDYKSFSKLVKRAVSEGLIRDEGFEHIAGKLQNIAMPNNRDVNDDTTPYVETLAEAMPSIRNKLAHGSNMLHMSGAISVKICADFINQLFSVDSASKAN